MFKWRKEKSQTNQSKQESLASITFSVDDNMEVNVLCEWSEESFDVVDIFAAMLFNIHNGNYASKTAEIFANEIRNNTENKSFLSEVVLKWKELNDNQIQNDNIINKQPIVRPTAFNDNAKIR